MQIYLGLIGDPNALIDDLMAMADAGTDSVDMRAMSLKGMVSRSRVLEASPEEIIELLTLTTDKDAVWFEDHRISGPEMDELLAEVADVIPFDSALGMKGRQMLAFIGSFTRGSAQSAESSEPDSDGPPATLPVAGSSGPAH